MTNNLRLSRDIEKHIKSILPDGLQISPLILSEFKQIN